jgi:hypothetical protein
MNVDKNLLIYKLYSWQSHDLALTLNAYSTYLETNASTKYIILQKAADILNTAEYLSIEMMDQRTFLSCFSRM